MKIYKHNEKGIELSSVHFDGFSIGIGDIWRISLVTFIWELFIHGYRNSREYEKSLVYIGGTCSKELGYKINYLCLFFITLYENYDK